MLLWVPLMVSGAEILVKDTGEGTEFLSGLPVRLPAAVLSTNRFGDGAPCIRDRPHCARPAAFEAAGQLALERAVMTNRFPAYLEGRPYVWFNQCVRHYTNYACTVTVDAPATFYLLLDNRVNDFAPDSEYNEPTLGPPDTAWVIQEGWERVNTGLSPKLGEKSRGDFVAIDEGANGTLNQFYAIYRKRVDRAGGSVVVRTAFEGNIYCLVVDPDTPTLSTKSAVSPR